MERVGRSLATREIREVGRVAGLWRYQVKSMAAEALDEADVSWHGLLVAFSRRAEGAGR
ncbi:MAG: hypothetical protein ACRD2C_01090 [Acidimicrobiales bacterium]